MKCLKSSFPFWKSWLQSEFLWNGNVRHLSDGGVTVSSTAHSFDVFKALQSLDDHMFQEVGVVGVVGVFCWHPRHSSFFQSVKGMIEALWLVSVQGGKFWNSICTIGSGNILIYRFLWRNKTEGCWRLTWKKCQKVALNRPPELHPEQTTPFSAVASMVGESWPQHIILRSSQMEGQYNTRSPGKKNFLFL